MELPEVLYKEVHRGNLCTYYVLPLIKLSKYSFCAEANFVDSFIAQDKQSIYVQIKDSYICRHRVSAHPQFLAILESEKKNIYVQFNYPADWADHMKLFLSGKYSKFSEQAIVMIKQFSGLQFRVRDAEGRVNTDIRLLALDKHKVVREIWEEYLDMELDPDAELLAAPTERTFMTDFPLRRI